MENTKKFEEALKIVLKYIGNQNYIKDNIKTIHNEVVDPGVDIEWEAEQKGIKDGKDWLFEEGESHIIRGRILRIELYTTDKYHNRCFGLNLKNGEIIGQNNGKSLKFIVVEK